MLTTPPQVGCTSMEKTILSRILQNAAATIAESIEAELSFQSPKAL
jgi:hypothetical protein